MVGTLRADRVGLDEVHRFANVPVRTIDGLHWDILRLYDEVLAGLRAARQTGPLVSAGVDSWAADHALLDADGRLLGNPYHYRDARTDGMLAAAAQLVAPEVHFARTGKAQLPFDTLYQLLAMGRTGDRRLSLTARLLMIPDLLHFWLCGEAATEYTNATTTGMWGIDGAWASDLLARFDLPVGILPAPVQPGTRLGSLRPAVCADQGLDALGVVAPGTHDTASAVLAIPHTAGGTPLAYISSGTWSLLGLELPQAITSDAARRAGFTNEGGVGQTYRFLTNIAGLWLLQECRRSWARAGQPASYEALTAAATSARPTGVVIDVDDPAFLHPADMPGALLAHLAETGQATGEDPVWLTRAILEGLALKYRRALARAEALAGVHAEVLHVVGGGARNALLCQMTADACGRPVLAGPAEATALGNVLAQAMGHGALRDTAQARWVVSRSVDVATYAPQGRDYWDAMAVRGAPEVAD